MKKLLVLICMSIITSPLAGTSTLTGEEYTPTASNFTSSNFTSSKLYRKVKASIDDLQSLVRASESIFPLFREDHFKPLFLQHEKESPGTLDQEDKLNFLSSENDCKRLFKCQKIITATLFKLPDQDLYTPGCASSASDPHKFFATPIDLTFCDKYNPNPQTPGYMRGDLINTH